MSHFIMFKLIKKKDILFYMIQNKFYINLDSDVERGAIFKDTDFVRWKATSREEVSDELDKRMRSMYNFPRQSHLGRCGCFHSHTSLLLHIIENKLNNVLICEDDAIQVNELPTEYPTDGIIYVGGFIHQSKMMDNTPVDVTLKKGINWIRGYRVLMTMSYIIPTWEVAHEMLSFIDARPRFSAIDIMYGNSGVLQYLNYPASFEESGSTSTIHKKTKRANRYYKWVKH